MSKKIIWTDVKYIIEVAANIISKDGKLKFVGNDDRGYVFSCDYRKATYLNTVSDAKELKSELITKLKIESIYIKIRTVKTEIY